MTAKATRVPLVRALTVRAALGELAALPPSIQEPILMRLPDDVRRVDEKVGVAWVPLALNMAISDAALEVMGPPAFRRFARDITLAFLKRPLLSTLVEASLRLFGIQSQSILRWAPRAWEALFQHCGSLEFEASSTARESRLRLHDFPREALASGSFVIGLAASFDAAFVVTKTTGQVEILSSNVATGEAAFRVRHYR